MRPSTWVTSPSSKQRTTWAIASHSRMLARNWLPSPSPFDAPRTRPAMSTKVRRVGMISFELAIAASVVEPRVGHGDVADVGLDGAERIIRRLGGGGLGERVEERRLADVGQADDAAFETHGDARPRVKGVGAALCADARKKARAARRAPGARRARPRLAWSKAAVVRPDRCGRNSSLAWRSERGCSSRLRWPTAER